jgi:TIGR03009 family protein
MQRFAFASVLFIVIPATGQESPPAPNLERLDTLLQDFEKRMSGLDSLSTRVKRTHVDALTKRETTFLGEVAFKKPGMWRLDLAEDAGKKDSDQNNFERIMCNGDHIYEYAPRQKQILVHDMPNKSAKQSWMQEIVNLAKWFDPYLFILRGMNGVNAKQRFDVTLTKETDWYAYLLIKPKDSADKQCFVSAQLVLWMRNPNSQTHGPDLTSMPCRLWIRQPNGTEITYEFSNTSPNAKLDKKSFTPSDTEGYRMIELAPRK